MRIATTCALSALMYLSSACAAAAPSAPLDAHDAPVPANEPRATIEVVVDLRREASCEEAFDLALYANRGVDLVEWQEAASGCTARRTKIRYLPSRLSREKILAMVKSSSLKMEVVGP